MLRRWVFAFCLSVSFVTGGFAQPIVKVQTDAPATVLPERTGMAPFLAPESADIVRSRPVWAQVDYLFAFVEGTRLPALATTSERGTARASAGVLGAAGTSTLFSGWVNSELRSGFRFSSGAWIGGEPEIGVEAGFIVFESKSTLFSRDASDGSILARPYIDARSGLPQAVLVAFPGDSTGSLDIRAASGNFYSASFALTEKALDLDGYRLVSLLGYRFYRYDESMRFAQVINPTDPKFVPGTQVFTNDSFRTRNEFHGIDFGFRSQFLWNNWTLDVTTKLAVGRVFRLYEADGDQTINAPGAAPVVRSGGVLALTSNSGAFSSRDWKVMSEVDLALGWRVNDNVSVRFGYTFLLLNGIARAADQIDTTLNPDLFPGNSITGIARPHAGHTRADLGIHSLNLGVLFTY